MPPHDLSPSDATLSRDDIARVLTSREGLRDVMVGLAARPRLDAEELLRVFVWLASSACAWLDGAFAVHVRAGATPRSIHVDFVEELGDGMSERLIPALEFQVDGAQLRKLLGFMQPLLKGIVSSSQEADILAIRRQPSRERRDTDPVTLKGSVATHFATRAAGVSDALMGELAELAAAAAERDDKEGT